MIDEEVDAQVVRLITTARRIFAHGVLSSRGVLEGTTTGTDTSTQLRTNIGDDPVDLDWFTPSVVMEFDLYNGIQSMLSRQLIVAVGDAVKRHGSLGWEDSDRPEIRFLWVIRNAAAHDNTIGYDGSGEPTPAWNGVELTAEHDGLRVFTEIGDIIHDEPGLVKRGFFEPGDALSLSADIRALFESSQNGDL